MITPPLELNDAIVSNVERFVAIGCESFECFFSKRRIEMFVNKPAPIGFALSALFFGHRFFVLYSLLLDKCNFVADGLCPGVVVEVERRRKVTNAMFPKLENVIDSNFFLCGEHDIEHFVKSGRSRIHDVE